ncbi:MAG: beta-propeller domain-containing protein [Nitrososphaeria archaeon]
MMTTKHAVLAGFIVAVTVLSAVAVPYLLLSKPQEETELKTFKSYLELKNYIEANTEKANYWFGVRGGGIVSGIKGALTSTVTQATESKPSYSTTNVQVEGVDESDILKNDGKYIYFVRQNQNTGQGELLILQVYPPEEAKAISKILWGENKQPIGIFINGDRLTVFLSIWDNVPIIEPKGAEYITTQKVGIEVYDVQDRANPRLARNITADGVYVNSRMIDEYVYVITAFPTYIIKEEVILPSICVDDKETRIEPSDIQYPDTPDVAYSFTTITSFNTQDDLQQPVLKTVLTGAASNIYVSTANIYLTLTKYDFEGYQNLQTNFEQTLVYRVHIEKGDIKLEAEGTVPGHVLNQFSMDEYRGFFRIATTVGQPFMVRGTGTSQSNNLYVLDSSLKVVGKIENIAPGESIYSARFMGDKAYMVTFKKVDPFFIIDVSEPSNPKILGWLKIPGYSDYLHPLDDSHVIGIGKEAVAAEEGDFAWYQGVKISLFDVTDVSKPKETSKYIIGERGTDTPVLRDHKALLFDRSRNLMVIPVLVAEIDRSQYYREIPANAYGQPVWQGAYVFDVTAEEGIILKGTITHFDDGFDRQQHYTSKFIERALYIGDFLYTISYEMVKMNDINSLAQVGEIKLT